MTTNFAEAELRVLAASHPRLAKASPTYDAATGLPTDLATVRAAEIFNVPEARVTPEQRDAAKRLLHAELYNRPASSFANRADPASNAGMAGAQNAGMGGARTQQAAAAAQYAWFHQNRPPGSRK